jgi:hypothetical protein
MPVISCRSREAVRGSDPEKTPEQKKNNESVTQNIQDEKQKQFRDEVVRILPRNPFEESLKESLY